MRDSLVINPSVFTSKRNHRKRILVIENDGELRHILSLIFDDEGYEYQMFNEAYDLLPLVNLYRPDLVLLDFRLPLVNGGELCLRLKNNRYTNHIPVIIYSAAPRAFLSVSDYKHDFFLPKPFDLEELLSKIRELTFISN
jgi:DNA-binding response OmpR family regulator